MPTRSHSNIDLYCRAVKVADVKLVEHSARTVSDLKLGQIAKSAVILIVPCCSLRSFDINLSM